MGSTHGRGGSDNGHYDKWSYPGPAGRSELGAGAEIKRAGTGSAPNNTARDTGCYSDVEIIGMSIVLHHAEWAGAA